MCDIRGFVSGCVISIQPSILPLHSSLLFSQSVHLSVFQKLRLIPGQDGEGCKKVRGLLFVLTHRDGSSSPGLGLAGGWWLEQDWHVIVDRCCHVLRRHPIPDWSTTRLRGSPGCWALWKLRSVEGSCFPPGSVPRLGATCIQRLVVWRTQWPNLLTSVWDHSKGPAHGPSWGICCVVWLFNAPLPRATSPAPALILQAPPVRFASRTQVSVRESVQPETAVRRKHAVLKPFTN